MRVLQAVIAGLDPAIQLVCAKLNHHTHRRCIFHCGYAAREQQRR